MSRFYVPSTKYELVEYLSKVYTDTSKSKFNSMCRKQLYAIYFSYRNKKFIPATSGRGFLDRN